ncbi:hypothetical protein ACEPAF_9635 [Sanghuangporus sanghuang]
MKAVATFHGPTSVVASIKTTLTDDEGLEFLVVAKSSVLEVFALLPDSLRLQCSLEIWGRIISLQSVASEENAQHNLLILTDHPDPRLILLNYVEGSAGSTPSLKTLKMVSLHERNSRPAEYVNTCLVDHKGKVAVSCSYTGKLRVLELEDGLISSDFDTSVRELNILSLCFLRTANARATVLAILYRDHLQKLRVTSHDLSVSDMEISPSASAFLPDFPLVDAGANLLIPVPPQASSAWNNNGGILILGGGVISFFSIDRKQKKKNNQATPKASSSRTPHAETIWPYFDVSAWSQVDAEGTRFLLGDSFGHLALLAIDMERSMLNVIFLGETSPPTSLTPLASQFVFVGSHFGDSQLIRIMPDKSSSTGTYIDVSETYKNIAPIMDAAVEDIDGSGQPTIVTCSGGGNTGSLRIVRNGASFTEDARIEGIANVFGTWPLKRRYDDEHHQFLLVATDTSSHLLEMSTAGHHSSYLSQSNEYSDLRQDVPTIAAANVLSRTNSATAKAEYHCGSQMVQVTQNTVLLFNGETGMSEDRWTPGHDRKIVLADISPSQICVALSGGEVILLTILGDKISEQNRKTFIEPDGTESEISALTIKPMKSDAKFSRLVILSFWCSHEIKAYTLPEFDLIAGTAVTLPHLPRSLLLHDFGDQEVGPKEHLMVALANGTVLTMPFDGKGGIGERKFFALGGAPVTLSCCNVSNQPAVFASGARSAIFYRSRDGISHSPVLVKDVLSASSLNTLMFSSSMVLSTIDGLVVGRIVELDKLHIRTVSMGSENPSRLAYNPGAKLFGVGCLKQDGAVMKGISSAVSSFKLVDDVDFKVTHEFSLETNEEITAVAAVSLELRGGRESFFVVGSTYFSESEREPSRGRLLIFSTGTGGRQYPHLFAAAQTKGAVNALACVEGKLVAAINTSVEIFNLMSEAEIKLERQTGWNHNYLVIAVAVVDNQIVVGDAVSSLAILKLEKDKLETIARDYSPLWPLCIGLFDQQTIVGANSDSNLFSYKLFQRGGKVLLEQNGLYNIDETVNKCVAGRLDPADNRFGLRTKQLLFTATGRITALIDVNEDISKLLSSLERNLANVVKGPGDVGHTHWRAPSNSRGRSDAQAAATGFLDGDFLERFFDYPATSTEMARILSGRNEAERIDTPYMQLHSILEALRNQH